MANVIRRCDPTHGAVRRRTTGLATHGQASSWSITIYMTGNEDPAIRKAALDAGCIAFLTKPFSVQALLEPLKKAAAGR